MAFLKNQGKISKILALGNTSYPENFLRCVFQKFYIKLLKKKHIKTLLPIKFETKKIYRRNPSHC